MNKIIENAKKIDIKTWREVLSVIAMILFCLIITEDFLGTTMFRFADKGTVLAYIYDISYAVIILRLCLDNFTSTAHRTKHVLFLALTVVIFMIVLSTDGYSELKTVLMCMLLLHGMDVTKIMKVFMFTIALLVVLTMIASLSNVIVNLIYTHPASRPRRISFGSVYPTDFAAYFVYLSLAWVFIRRHRITFLELLLILFVGGATYHYCDTRMDSLTLVLIAFAFSIVKIFDKYAIHRKKDHVFPQWLLAIGTLSYPICGASIIGLSAIYSPNNSILKMLNKLLSDRLLYGHKALVKYGFSILGQQVTVHGNGGTTLYYFKESFYIDASFLQVFIKYGFLVFIIVSIFMFGSSIMAYKKNDYYVILILAILFIHCMIEQHMIQVCYDPFLFLFLANWDSISGDSVLNKMKTPTAVLKSNE